MRCRHRDATRKIASLDEQSVTSHRREDDEGARPPLRALGPGGGTYVAGQR